MTNFIAALPASPADKPAARFEELNGIRGWAALSVVAFHMIWETFGAVLPQLRNPVTGFLLDGSLAVSIFFVLSGEAMSSGYFTGGGEFAVTKLAIKRYSRLTVPIAVACLITYTLYTTGLVFNIQASSYVNRSDWLGLWLNPPPDFFALVRYVLVYVYTGTAQEHAVIPFLWTMQIEMQGSFLVFGILLMFSRLRYPWLLIIGLFTVTVVFFRSFGNYACFLAGMFFGSLRATGFFARMQRNRLVSICSLIAVIMIACFDGFCHWKKILRGVVDPTAVVLLFSLFCNAHLCALFRSRISIFLGKISFPLYLIQFPFLVSITSFAICFANARGGVTPPVILMISTGSILGCLASACVFEPVEKLTRWVGNQIAGVFLAER